MRWLGSNPRRCASANVRPPARQRAQPRALDANVEITVDDIVIDAPRAAHREGAEAEPQEQGPAAADAPQRHAPRARPVEQPAADRPIEPHEAGIGPQPRREAADESTPLAVGDDVRNRAHRMALTRLFRGPKADFARDCDGGAQPRVREKALVVTKVTVSGAFGVTIREPVSRFWRKTLRAAR